MSQEGLTSVHYMPSKETINETEAEMRLFFVIKNHWPPV